MAWTDKEIEDAVRAFGDFDPDEADLVDVSGLLDDADQPESPLSPDDHEG